MMIKTSRNLAAAVLSSLLCALSAPAMAGPVTLETFELFDGTAPFAEEVFSPVLSQAGIEITPIEIVDVAAPRLGTGRFGDFVVYQVTVNVEIDTPVGTSIEQRSGIIFQRFSGLGVNPTIDGARD